MPRCLTIDRLVNKNLIVICFQVNEKIVEKEKKLSHYKNVLYVTIDGDTC